MIAVKLPHVNTGNFHFNRRGAAASKPLWQPNPDHPDGTPNPQRLAYESEADIIGYGGQAGSGKTDLLFGMALKHKHSVIFRRVFPLLRGIIERSREIFNPGGQAHVKDSYNESLHRWSLDNGKQIIEFESCQYEDDKKKQQGRPRGFYGFDEAPQFTRSQIEFITAWNRSTDPDEHCQVCLTFNPPIDEDENWITDYFLPWLANLFPDKFTHPNPAKPGELRWYATVDGKEVQCKDGTPFYHEGQEVRPRSRTFIPGKLTDNPHLANTNYGSVIDSLPEPLRSILKGNFAAGKKDNPWQVLPTAWVRAAQQRWLDRVKPQVPLTAVGIDAVRGGDDNGTIAKRYDNWFDEILSFPGAIIEDGPAMAEVVRHNVEADPAYMNIDVIGVGSSPYDFLKAMYPVVIPVNASEASSYRDKSGKLKMRNKRAEYYWQFREALDPSGGDDLALPPGNELLADLCAATYKVTSAGVQIEEKAEIRKRIGRSPDKGEAVLLAYYTDIISENPFI